jgi:hypothetical protein
VILDVRTQESIVIARHARRAEPAVVREALSGWRFHHAGRRDLAAQSARPSGPQWTVSLGFGNATPLAGRPAPAHDEPKGRRSSAAVQAPQIEGLKRKTGRVRAPNKTIGGMQ